MTIASEVSEKDIICGRGRGFDVLPGNQIFRAIIADNVIRYARIQKSRKEKSVLIQMISQCLKKKNMRFIRRDKLGCKILNQKEINLKIGHALRDVIPVQRKSEKRIFKRIMMLGDEIDATISVTDSTSIQSGKVLIRTVSSNSLDNDLYSLHRLETGDHDTDFETPFRTEKERAKIGNTFATQESIIVDDHFSKTTHAKYLESVLPEFHESHLCELEWGDIYYDFVNDDGDDNLIVHG